MPTSGQPGMRILSQLLSSPYLESLREQMKILETLNFDPIMMRDEIMVNVGKLFNFAYRFKVPGIALIKVGFENKVTGSEAERKEVEKNILNFNKLKGMVSEKLNAEMARVEKMRLDSIQAMGSLKIDLGGQDEG
jgi:hypothetical protein